MHLSTHPWLHPPLYRNVPCTTHVVSNRCHLPVHKSMDEPRIIAPPSSDDDLPSLLHREGTGVLPAMLETEGALHPWVVEGAVASVTVDTLSTHYWHIIDKIIACYQHNNGYWHIISTLLTYHQHTTDILSTHYCLVIIPLVEVSDPGFIWNN